MSPRECVPRVKSQKDAKHDLWWSKKGNDDVLHISNPKERDSYVSNESHIYLLAPSWSLPSANAVLWNIDCPGLMSSRGVLLSCRICPSDKDLLKMLHPKKDNTLIEKEIRWPHDIDESFNMDGCR